MAPHKLPITCYVTGVVRDLHSIETTCLTLSYLPLLLYEACKLLPVKQQTGSHLV